MSTADSMTDLYDCPHCGGELREHKPGCPTLKQGERGADLVKRLRSVGNGDTWSSYEVIGLVKQAADAIERLRADVVEWKRQAGKYTAGCELCEPLERENERLRAALKASSIPRMLCPECGAVSTDPCHRKDCPLRKPWIAGQSAKSHSA